MRRYMIFTLIAALLMTVNFALIIHPALAAANTFAGVALPLLTGTPDQITIANPYIYAISEKTLVMPGETLGYTFTVTNAGSEAALNVIVTDELPSPLNFINATESQGSHQAIGNTVAFSVGTIEPGAMVTLRVVTQIKNFVAPPMDVNNTAILNFFGGLPRSSAASVRITRGVLPDTGQHPDDSTLPPYSLLGTLAVITVGSLAAVLVTRRGRRS